jgi:uncharacterized membrane protein
MKFSKLTILFKTKTKSLKIDLSIIIFVLFMILKYVVIFTLMLWTWNTIMSGTIEEIFKKGTLV